MKNIKAVVFDMDGLMIDTERLWVESMLEAGKQLNYNYTQEYLVSIAGLRKDLYDAQLSEHMGEGFDVKKVRALALDIFDQKMESGQLRAKTGVKEIVAYFKQKGFVLAIASSSEKEEVMHRLNLIGVDIAAFKNIIGGDMVKKAKPDPEIYIKSCQILGLEPENVLALEDSDVGIEAAGKAGLVPIHIPDLKPSTEKTRQYAFKTFENLFDVINLFENIKD